MSQKYKIKYGWCNSDWKDGKEMFKDLSRKDYVFGSQYSSMVQETLANFGFPMPKKEEVFRGCNHDMLFLDSHGLVVRMGPMDIYDMLNPTILQPIGWKSFKTPHAMYPVTVAVYPGIELLGNLSAEEDIQAVRYNFEKLLKKSGQGEYDTKIENIGFVPVINNNGKMVNTPILLDMDSNFNGSIDTEMAEARRDIRLEALDYIDNKADLMSAVINTVFGNKPHLQNNIKVFEVHQPLRRKFWEACSDEDNIDTKALKSLWNECAQSVDKCKSHMFPVWKKVGAVYKRTEMSDVNVNLSAPWVKKSAYQIQKSQKVVEL